MRGWDETAALGWVVDSNNSAGKYINFLILAEVCLFTYALLVFSDRKQGHGHEGAIAEKKKSRYESA